MREAAFLRRNQARWQQYETQPPASPDDLAYAQTFYPTSPTTAYLNTLTGKLHQTLYQNKAEQRGRFGQFWRREVPLVVSRHGLALRWALLVFVLSALIGALSAAYDDTFVRVVLGDEYVNRTLASIHRGDPMAVYKGTAEAPMFLFITYNNIRVALFTFALGVTGGVGTSYMLFYNGVMLGAFQFFFFRQKVLLASLLTIWIHGTLEISSIVLAGGAGYVLARGLLFPGTYSRAEAFRLAAREGLKLALGLVPLFCIAGFLESFVTRHTGMPLALSLFIIGSSAAFIGWYFGVLPAQLRRREAQLAA